MTKTIDPAKVPASALRFAASIDIADGDDPSVTLYARSPQPIEHPFWGKVAHDMSGARFEKPTIPLDYNHDPDQIVGYGDKFKADNEGLVVSGKLTPFTATDKASEIINKQRRKVPYEASINFFGQGIKLEFVPENGVSQVNGYEFQGPGYIIRSWPLRGVAICPYGADPNTEAQFSADGQTVGVHLFTQEHAEMPEAQPTATVDQETKPVVDETKPATDETKTGDAEPKTAPVETPPEAAQLSQAAAGKKFMDAFGEAKGALYFAQGHNFETATVLFAKDVAKENAELSTKLTELQKQVTDLRGTNPAHFQAEQTEAQKQQAAKVVASDNAFDKFKSGIKIKK